MKACPTCGARYVDAATFCPEDGVRLVDADAPAPSGATSSGSASSDLEAWLAGALGEAPPSRESQPEAPSASSPAGSDVAEENDSTPPLPARRAPAGSARRSRRPLVAVLVAVLAVVLVGGAFGATTLLGARRLEGQAMGAIARGDLVTPPRMSALDNYRRLEAKTGAALARERVADAALPALTTAMDAVYDRWYATSDTPESDWDRVAAMGAWATELQPADPHLVARHQYALARLADREARLADVRAGYEAAIAAWPEWALPYNSLALWLARDRQTDAAIEQYRTAARLDPAWAFPHANLGALYLRQRRIDAARDELRQAVRLDPSRATTHAELARAHAAAGDYDDAVAEATEALRLDPYGTAGFDRERLIRDARGWRDDAADAAEPESDVPDADEGEEPAEEAPGPEP